MTQWHIYALTPVDYWQGTRSVSEHIQWLLGRDWEEYEPGSVSVAARHKAVTAFAEYLVEAGSALTRANLHWENDVLRMAVLLDVDGQRDQPALLIKHGNNGDTFLVSQRDVRKDLFGIGEKIQDETMVPY